MKVAMIDPSLFVIPYDRALCAALEEKGATVRFFGRPLREGEEAQLHGRVMEPVFYRLAETGPARRMPKSVRLKLKGLDHIMSLTQLARELKKWKPDVIHFQWFPLPIIDRLFIGCLRRIAPVVATVHDTIPFNANPSSLLQSWHAFTVFTLCDSVIVHTANAISVLSQQGVRQDRIACIPHGILDLPSDTQGAHATADRKKGKIRFLQFGIIKPYKGVDVLLRAVASMPADIRDRCEFLVAGRAVMDVSGFLALRNELGLDECLKFDFRYFAEDEMTQILSSSDVLLFPYREIEASGVLYATLSFGKPVIATRIGIFSELLVDGVHGILTEPDDVPGLAAAIDRLGRDASARDRMGEHVKTLSQKVTSWADIAESTMTAYRSAIGARQ